MSIIFKKVNHIYAPNTPFEHLALNEIDLELVDGKMCAIIGHTGSGKSTLVQHMNALLLPTSGEVHIDDYVVKNEKNKGLKQLRKKVGLVFQFPEYQLFEDSVEKDICFGPKNFGISEEECKKIAKEVIKLVGLDESLLSCSPFELSGGQKRRVAIAGILAMNPDVLVLDEPTAGLDPSGAKEMLNLFVKLNKQGKTILIVTHEMDYVLEYADECIVLKEGKLEFQGTPSSLFSNQELLNKVELEVPSVFDFALKLNKKGFNLDLSKIKDVNSLSKEIASSLRGGSDYE